VLPYPTQSGPLLAQSARAKEVLATLIHSSLLTRTSLSTKHPHLWYYSVCLQQWTGPHVRLSDLSTPWNLSPSRRANEQTLTQATGTCERQQHNKSMYILQENLSLNLSLSISLSLDLSLSLSLSLSQTKRKRNKACNIKNSLSLSLKNLYNKRSLSLSTNTRTKSKKCI